eukprot:g4787.t1
MAAVHAKAEGKEAKEAKEAKDVVSHVQVKIEAEGKDGDPDNGGTAEANKNGGGGATSSKEKENEKMKENEEPFLAVAAAAERDASIASRRARIVCATFSVDLISTTLLAIYSICDFDFSRCSLSTSRDVVDHRVNVSTSSSSSSSSSSGFDIRSSNVDILILDIARIFIVALCFGLLRLTLGQENSAEDEKIFASVKLDCKARPPTRSSMVAQTVGWWVLFFLALWSVTKIVMWRWILSRHTLFAIVATICTVVECKATQDLLRTESRRSQLHKLLIGDIFKKVNSGRALADQLEDPQGRFYDDPEKKRMQLLEPQKGVSIVGLWKIMRAYVWPQGLFSKFRIAATFAIMAGSKACSILSPLFIGMATQRLSDEGVVPYREIVIYTALSFGSVALQQLQKLVYLGVKQHAFAEIATHTFMHLHSLSLDWHLQKKMGRVLRIMDRGIASADSVMNYVVLYLLPSIVQAGIVIAIFYVRFQSAELAGAALFSFIAYCVITIEITQWRKRYRKKSNKHDNEYHSIATDALMNFETVKLYCAEDYETDRFNKSVKKYQKHNIATQASLALLNTTQQFDIQCTTMIALMITATAIIHQTSDKRASENIGDFVSANAYILQLYAPLSFLGTIYSTIVQALVDMTNLSELLLVNPDVQDDVNAKALQLGATKEKGAKIEFRDVKFCYPSQPTRGLHGVSFTVEPGTTTAIVGHTGAGKSTISKLLFRFYDIDSGGIFIDGQDISKVTQKSLRGSIGVVPQDTVLFNSTLIRNIQYGSPNADFATIREAAKNAQILPFIESLETKWDTAVGERGLKISGGEKQRVAIARCLLKDPPIVVLDEATSALDSTTEAALQDALSKLRFGRTQICIAHRLSTIKNAEQIVVLNDGRVEEKGSHEELLAKGGAYSRLWEAQLSETTTFAQTQA